MNEKVEYREKELKKGKRWSSESRAMLASTQPSG